MGKGDMNGNKTGNGFDKNPQNINRKGRPKTFSISRAAKELLKTDGILILANVIEVVKEIDENGKAKWVETGRVFESAKVKVPNANSVAMSMLKKAQKGDVKAASFLADRTEGKAVQPIKDVTNEPELTPKEIDAELKQLEKEEKDFAAKKTKAKGKTRK